MRSSTGFGSSGSPSATRSLSKSTTSVQLVSYSGERAECARFTTGFGSESPSVVSSLTKFTISLQKSRSPTGCVRGYVSM